VTYELYLTPSTSVTGMLGIQIALQFTKLIVKLANKTR